MWIPIDVNISVCFFPIDTCFYFIEANSVKDVKGGNFIIFCLFICKFNIRMIRIWFFYNKINLSKNNICTSVYKYSLSHKYSNMELLVLLYIYIKFMPTLIFLNRNIYFYILFQFIFCSKRIKTIQTIKITKFWSFLYNNADNFFYCKIMPSFFFFVWNH